MLKDLSVAAVLPASDISRARDFYRDKLGLEPDNPEATDNLMYKCGNGTAFMIYQTPNAGTAKNTQMGWQVADLDQEMADLKSRGVVFEEYDFPGLKTENGVATMPDGERGSWFLDSEGNILSIATMP
ncbi:VOC family protein [Arthrobacter cavernae]|uniref:VOC family protein n=1 Tax=Arthrobacter cavernae TaxID=2817681 RepID=A0A939HHJ2_9MICC|nr:VOC family protein [Arthrobacter cavernae]MBO1269374.1 VOC family protein [Arthrobacter cavernae]